MLLNNNFDEILVSARVSNVNTRSNSNCELINRPAYSKHVDGNWKNCCNKPCQQLTCSTSGCNKLVRNVCDCTKAINRRRENFTKHVQEVAELKELGGRST